MLVTPAEFRVLRAFLYDGADNATLARRLELGMPTIRSHMKSLYRRTGTAGRAELAVAVLRGRINVQQVPVP